MDWPHLSLTLIIALWGAILATVLAVRDARRFRTRFGVIVQSHFRLGDSPGIWEWLAIEVIFRNASDRATSIVECSISIRIDDHRDDAGVPVEFREAETGETQLWDPGTRQGVTLRGVALQVLPVPINLPARASIIGSIAFHFRQPVPDEIITNSRAVLRVVDVDHQPWFADFVLGRSLPWSRNAEIIEICPFDPLPVPGYDE